MEKGLVLNKISKTYQDVNGEVLAIKDFSYSFNQGDFVSIVGPSGCGKSTLSFYNSRIRVTFNR